MVTLRSQRSTGKATLPEMSDLAGFQFYKFMYYGISMEELVLPDKFASALRGREPREMKLRMACCEGRSAWDVEVIVDEYGDMCLGGGWREFAGANGLEPGQLLVFHFDGAALLTVKVFDDSDCRRSCQHAEDDGAGESSLPLPDTESESGGSSEDEEWDGAEEPDDTTAPAPAPGPSLFSVMLSKCHFGLRNGQYLNVPPEFDQAHGYAARTKVELQMRGESWTVNLKHSKRGSKRSGWKTRTAFRYGWRQFCVDNALGLGDTCFFQARGEGEGRGEVHVLRVEVRKPDGTTLR
ncbi:unnamed protein product [Alopecurus aequalis]